MRFDWYQATIQDDPCRGFDLLRKLGDKAVPCDGLARAYRYDQGFHIQHQDRGTVATIMMGGNGDGFHAWASSDNTDDFAALVREVWPDRHLVTRADAAQDLIAEGVTRKVLPVMRRVAKRNRLKFERRSDALDRTAGLTQYMGSKTSDYQVRGYEKGFEVAGKIDVLVGGKVPREQLRITNTLTGELIRPEDWFRLELQCRPRQEEGRRTLASLEPAQVWGVTDWTRELAKDALALELEAVVMRTRKHSARDEKLGWMCRFYGGVLLELIDEKGERGAMQHLVSIIRRQKSDVT
jgi:hypothetical protein